MKDEEMPREATPAETERSRRLAAIADETGGMRCAFDALQPLDGHARKRALRWLAEALDDIEVPF
jgi:hypothetical protein